MTARGVRTKRPLLLATLFGGIPLAPQLASGDIAITGDATLYETLIGLIEPLNFPIVTP